MTKPKRKPLKTVARETTEFKAKRDPDGRIYNEPSVVTHETGPVGQRRLHGAISNVQSLIDSATMLTDDLQERLESVMGPESPTHKEENNRVQPAPGSPIVNQIDLTAERVQNINRRLQTILTRIEL